MQRLWFYSSILLWTFIIIIAAIIILVVLLFFADYIIGVIITVDIMVVIIMSTHNFLVLLQVYAYDILFGLSEAAQSLNGQLEIARRTIKVRL